MAVVLMTQNSKEKECRKMDEKKIMISGKLMGESIPVMNAEELPKDGCYSFRMMAEVDIRPGQQIVLDIPNPFAPETKVYGEGYSMLAQYAGTVSKLECIGSLDDKVHYKMWSDKNWNQVYNMALFEEENGTFTLIGFSSCNRYVGCVRFTEDRLQVVLNMEQKQIQKGSCVELEDLYIKRGTDRNALLEAFAEEIECNHPRIPAAKQPTGWCSWYCYGPNVTEKNILDNLDSIKAKNIDLTYVQVDDGYQKYMGDWLTAADSFPAGIKSLFDKIREKGFQPAIWIAPFIAEGDSEVFQTHPEWFVQGEDGKPLSSAEFTFGGWRCAPWYMLDPTHPGAYEHLKEVFRTIKEEWKCHYFKLDANMWGCFPEGIRYDKQATCVEAYRLGMKAILEGAGTDSIILGCNAPMWPSIGAVHANRVTGDVHRQFDIFTVIAGEGFHRNWQHGKLWINDPDCVTIERNFIRVVDFAGKPVTQQANISEDEFKFHATYIYASGGMVLSGDDLSQQNLEHEYMLRYLLKEDHEAARFDDDTFQIGRVRKTDGLALCLFNWGDTEKVLEVALDGAYEIFDVWEQKDMGRQKDMMKVTMPAHSGCLFECKAVN